MPCTRLRRGSTGSGKPANLAKEGWVPGGPITSGSSRPRPPAANRRSNDCQRILGSFQTRAVGLSPLTGSRKGAARTADDERGSESGIAGLVSLEAGLVRNSAGC